MAQPLFLKYSGEKIPVGWILSPPEIDAGETIASCVVTIDPLVSGELEAVGSVIIGSEPSAAQMLAGGLENEEYVVTYEMTTSGSKIIIKKIIVRIIF